MQRAIAWHETHSDVILEGGAALYPVDTATTVRGRRGIDPGTTPVSATHLREGGTAEAERDLADDAVWLARVVAKELPDDPEAHGMVALLSFHMAFAARVGEATE